jgi:hypothetical protein
MFPTPTMPRRMVFAAAPSGGAFKFVESAPEPEPAGMEALATGDWEQSWTVTALSRRRTAITMGVFRVSVQCRDNEAARASY